MHVRNLSDLLDREIRHLHCLESELFEALPELILSASDVDLEIALQRARAITVWQRERLRLIPRTVGMPFSGEPCRDVAGMLEQLRQFTRYTSEPEVRDAALRAGFRRIAAYQRTCYEAARDHAQILGEDRAVDLLDRSLHEEEATLVDIVGLDARHSQDLLLRTA